VAIDRWERGDATGFQIGAASLVVCLAAFLVHRHRPVLSAAEIVSALCFVVLDHWRRRLTADAVRVLADVALLSPIFFLPIAGTLS
jgi:hypothetical protein